MSAVLEVEEFLPKIIMATHKKKKEREETDNRLIKKDRERLGKQKTACKR